MKNKLLILGLSIILNSCTVYNCGDEIVNVSLYSVVNTKTTEKFRPNWYNSEFQKGLLNFGIEFDIKSCNSDDPFGNYKSFWVNHVVEDSIKLTCNKDVSNDLDTIKAGQLLNNCFVITKFSGISSSFYIISEKESNNYKFDKLYYTFKVSIITTDSKFMEDSCIVKKI